MDSCRWNSSSIKAGHLRRRSGHEWWEGFWHPAAHSWLLSFRSCKLCLPGYVSGENMDIVSGEGGRLGRIHRRKMHHESASVPKTVNRDYLTRQYWVDQACLPGFPSQLCFEEKLYRTILASWRTFGFPIFQCEEGKGGHFAKSHPPSKKDIWIISKVHCQNMTFQTQIWKHIHW